MAIDWSRATLALALDPDSAGRPARIPSLSGRVLEIATTGPTRRLNVHWEYILSFTLPHIDLLPEPSTVPISRKRPAHKLSPLAFLSPFRGTDSATFSRG